MTDYSEGGARLQLAQSKALPSRIALSFDGFTGSVRCEIRHSSATSIGVEFCQSKSKRDTDPQRIVELIRWLGD